MHGNIDGIGHTYLYQKAKFGTKHLIEDYVEEICEALELLDSLGPEDVNRASVKDLLRRARHSFGSPPTARPTGLSVLGSVIRACSSGTCASLSMT